MVVTITTGMSILHSAKVCIRANLPEYHERCCRSYPAFTWIITDLGLDYTNHILVDEKHL